MSEVTVKEVYNQVGVADGVAASPTCSVDEQDDVVSVSGCTVTLDESHTAGASAVDVTVRTGSHSASVAVRVWFPQEVQVWVSDAWLNAIAGAFQVQACAQPRFQSTNIAATATFGGAGLSNASRLDVSCMVKFASTNSTALEVSGTSAQGLSVGQADLYITGGAEALETMGRAQVEVAQTEVTVEHMSAMLTTGAEWDAL
eukprot:gene33625-43258_t